MAQSEGGKRELLVSRTWVQVAGLVITAGFFVLVFLAYRTYQSDPPIPDRVVGPSGQLVFTGADIRAGQKVFLQNGLMEYGSIFGHGAYLGPDFTADYLHRSSRSVIDQLGGNGSDSARQETIDQFQANRYDSATSTLPISAQQARAFGQLERHYGSFFETPTTKYGLRPEHSEAGRFHRGIAVALVGFGALVICAGAALHHRAGDLAVLGGALLICGALGLYLLADLRSAPAGFPWPDGERSGALATSGRSERSSIH